MSTTAHHTPRCCCLHCSVFALRRFRAAHALALELGDGPKAALMAELVQDTEDDVTEAIRVALGADEAQPLPEALRPAYAAAVTAGLAKPLKEPT